VAAPSHSALRRIRPDRIELKIVLAALRGVLAIRTDPEERIGGWLSRAGRFTKARSPPDLHTQLALIVLGLSQSVLCQTNDRAEQDL